MVIGGHQEGLAFQHHDHAFGAGPPPRAAAGDGQPRREALAHEGAVPTQGEILLPGMRKDPHGGYFWRMARTPGRPSAGGSGSGLPYRTA